MAAEAAEEKFERFDWESSSEWQEYWSRIDVPAGMELEKAMAKMRRKFFRNSIDSSLASTPVSTPTSAPREVSEDMIRAARGYAEVLWDSDSEALLARAEAVMKEAMRSEVTRRVEAKISSGSSQESIDLLVREFSQE